MKRIFTSIPFLIGVFLVVYAGFGLVYFQKHAERQDLYSQMTPLRAVLKKPPPDSAALKRELSQVEAEFEAAWKSFPSSEQGLELYSALIDVAEKSNVTVGSVGAGSSTDRQEDGISYSLFPYQLSVQGSHEDILAFTSNLAEGPGILQGLQVGSIQISSGAPLTTPESDNITGGATDNVTGGATDNATANLVLSIYARPVTGTGPEASP